MLLARLHKHEDNNMTAQFTDGDTCDHGKVGRHSRDAETKICEMYIILFIS